MRPLLAARARGLAQHTCKTRPHPLVVSIYTISTDLGHNDRRWQKKRELAAHWRTLMYIGRRSVEMLHNFAESVYARTYTVIRATVYSKGSD